MWVISMFQGIIMISTKKGTLGDIVTLKMGKDMIFKE